MTRYVVGRLFESVLVLALMSFVIYALIALMPGDPIDIMVQSNPDLTPEDAARLKALYGLDKPIFERYWNWLTAAAERDFGYSRIHSRPVLEVMGPRLANTGLLMGLALVLSLAIALPVGIYSALRPYS
ncbi:MAG TPA: ABC transporter permease, partial [Alphaproteobacteria bacterium]|nr:ABC transporter permease [Alphaproteobacteria bacterium]